VIFTSLSLSGIWAAVQAGLGVTLRSPVGLPGALAQVAHPLPTAGAIGITLWLSQSLEANAQEQLLSAVSAALLPAMLR